MRDTVRTCCDTTVVGGGRLLSSGLTGFGFTDCNQAFLRGFPVLGCAQRRALFLTVVLPVFASCCQGRPLSRFLTFVALPELPPVDGVELGEALCSTLHRRAVVL